MYLLSSNTLSPSFDSNQTNGYVLNLNTATTTNFSINAVAKTSSDTRSAMRENGSDYEPIELNNISFVTAGNNSTMLIIITVGEGERAIQYEIQVVKPTYIGLPELSRLAIDGEQITLVSGVYTYEITLEEKDSYYVTATIKDTNNYMFNEFLVPPVEISSKEFELDIVPKDATAGLRSAMYHITIKTNEIEPVTNPTTTKKPSSSSSSGNGSIENPQTGTSAYVVGIILVSSLALSMYLYKKNINGYN